MTFEELGLSARFLAKLAEAGLTDPTPIQQKAIPLALEGRDVMGLAQTGTGKTLAFGAPLIEALQKIGTKPDKKTARALILAPTRELAKQIADSLRVYTKGSHLKVQMVVGGAGIVGQTQRLERGTDLLVATPGRLLDLEARRALDLSATRFLVLDEADQMLDMGFIHDLRKISAKLAEERQTMLFSATMPKQMEELAGAYLKNPTKVQVSPPGKTADKITQTVHFLQKRDKYRLLVSQLDAHKDERAIIFGRTKHGCEKLYKNLEKDGFGAASIHGNKSQGQRDRALQAFRDGTVKVLVATDVAARGIDIPDVKFVYNYELPNVPDNYVHRIGRTARAGAEGKAVAYCAPDEIAEFKDILKTIKIDIPIASGEPWEPLDQPGTKKKSNNRRRGGGGGGRPNGGGGRPGGFKKGGGGKPSGPNGAKRGGQRRRKPRAA